MDIYTTPALPYHYVTHASDRRYYFFPVSPRGWDTRRPYNGPLVGLIPVDSATAPTIIAQAGAGFDIMAPLDRPWIAL